MSFEAFNGFERNKKGGTATTNSTLKFYPCRSLGGKKHNRLKDDPACLGLQTVKVLYDVEHLLAIDVEVSVSLRSHVVISEFGTISLS